MFGSGEIITFCIEPNVYVIYVPKLRIARGFHFCGQNQCISSTWWVIPLTTYDVPERHKGLSFKGYISHVCSYRYLVLLFSKTFGRGILSPFSEYLEFRAAPRLYVGVLKLNRAMRLFLVLLTPFLRPLESILELFSSLGSLVTTQK